MYTFKRCSNLIMGIASVFFFGSLGGCVEWKQTQFFSVEDPDTGATNYYRLHIRGQSGLAEEYHMQAGYFSAASVDILRGKMPKFPELDLPIEREKTYDRLLEHLDRMIFQEAKRLAPITDSESIAIAANTRLVETQKEADALSSQREALIKGHEAAERDVTQKKEGLATAETALAKAKEDLDPMVDAYNKAKKKVDELAADAADDVRSPLEQAMTDAKAALAKSQAEYDLAAKKVASAKLAKKYADDRNKKLAEDLKRVKARQAYNATIEKELQKHITKLMAEFGKQAFGLVGGSPEPPLSTNELNKRYIQLARLVWFNSLSGADIASVGMAEDLNPFVFRKLVFWTSASAVDLNQIAGEVDAIADNVVKIGQSFKQAAKQKSETDQKQVEDQTKRVQEALKQLRESNTLTEPQKAQLESMLKMLYPQAAPDAPADEPAKGDS